MGGQTVASGLPPAVLADLRQAFGREVRNRLPHLTCATDLEPDLEPDLETARRDAHTIASSAWIVGELEIARLAREVESTFPEGPVAELLDALRSYVA